MLGAPPRPTLLDWERAEEWLVAAAELAVAALAVCAAYYGARKARWEAQAAMVEALAAPDLEADTEPEGE